jgi:hypothetical protein
MTQAHTRDKETLAIEKKVCDASLNGLMAALKPLVANLEGITIVVQLKSSHGRLGHCRPHILMVDGDRT